MTDLLLKNFGSVIHHFTIKEMFTKWLSIKNREGFSYEKTTGVDKSGNPQKEVVTDFPYLSK